MLKVNIPRTNEFIMAVTNLVMDAQTGKDGLGCTVYPKNKVRAIICYLNNKFDLIDSSTTENFVLEVMRVLDGIESLDGKSNLSSKKWLARTIVVAFFKTAMSGTLSGFLLEFADKVLPGFVDSLLDIDSGFLKCANNDKGGNRKQWKTIKHRYIQ